MVVSEELKDVCISDNLGEALRMLRLGLCNIDAVDESVMTALHWAFSCWPGPAGVVAVTSQLLAAGAKVDAQDYDGETALHKTAIIGIAVWTSLLLATRAKVDVLAKNGRTALHYAAEPFSGNAEVTSQPKVDVQDKDGCTALHMAAMRGEQK